MAPDVGGAATGGSWDSVWSVCGGQLDHGLRAHTGLHACGGEELTKLPVFDVVVVCCVSINP